MMYGVDIAIRAVKEADYGRRSAERGKLLLATSLDMTVERGIAETDRFAIGMRDYEDPIIGRTKIYGRMTVHHTVETRDLLADAFNAETKSYTIEIEQTYEDGKVFVSRLVGAVIAKATLNADCNGPILADYTFEARSIEFEGHDGCRPRIAPVGGDTWFCDYCGSRWPWAEYRCTSCAGGRQPERNKG